MSAWQPIETAPRDGTAVLLLSKAYAVDGGPEFGTINHPAKVAIGSWDPTGTSWVDEFGSLDGDACTLAVTGVWLSGGGWFEPNEVTHWQPLPAPPEGA